jgi:hypothetical protein
MIVLAVEVASKRDWFPDSSQLLLLKVNSCRFAFGCTADSLVNKMYAFQSGFFISFFCKSSCNVDVYNYLNQKIKVSFRSYEQ